MVRNIKMVTLDISTTITGWAYFENGILKDSGILDMHKEKDTVIRIEDMAINIVGLLNRYKPQIVICEEQAFARTVNVAVMIAKLLGVVQGWCLTAGYAEFSTLRPSYWRKLIAGTEIIPKDRKEVKAWDITKATTALGRIPIDDNEADAVLIGIARIKEFEQLTA